jgi:recombination protein RecA
MAAQKDRDKALDVALANIDKQFGKGAIMRLGSTERPPVEVIPTGSIALDGARHRWIAARAHRRNLRTRIFG